MRTVRCATSGCPNEGIVRNVADRPAATGVVYRPDLYCAECGGVLDKPTRANRREKAVRRAPEKRG